MAAFVSAVEMVPLEQGVEQRKLDITDTNIQWLMNAIVPGMSIQEQTLSRNTSVCRDEHCRFLGNRLVEAVIITDGRP
jgi:hypothetical protein